MYTSPSRVSVILLSLVTTLLFGCGKIAELRQRYLPKTPREDYVRGLEETGLMGTVMGEWHFLTPRRPSPSMPHEPDLTS